MASKLTEVMVRPFIETKDASISLMAEKELVTVSEKCASVVIGPGICDNRETHALIRNLITKIDKPLVLDAGALDAITGQLNLLKEAKLPPVLTPHPGELSRLIGKDREEIQRSRKDIAIQFANEYNTVLVLKGHETVVAAPDGRSYINNTGNPGMASGGTGDVLAGMIGSFVGQGIDSFSASIMAVYFHGLAGDIAVKDTGPLSLIATDLLDKLPEVLKVLA